jgi:valyl-tRNA synthetase
MSLSARYQPQETETKWYDYWLKKNYFHSEPDEREPFTVVIPPPNVTGVLHMGHMLNNTIQDILIRKARLSGKNACWVPGTDHASIATEAKVVRLLREQGIKKGDIGRDAFLEHAFAWKDKYGGIILDQLKRLGASCDWERTRFTMEPSLSDAVLHVFVNLYEKGRIYRGLRMTQWDPEALTVLSNEEVIYKEENARLFHLKYYRTDNPALFITIATQRPETIMADVAIAVHPQDERYQSFIGKSVFVPLINREIPIIADAYVDISFGTGALKITPAHDQNDYEIGKKHKLPVIDILTPNGKLNEKATILVGQDRFEARKNIKKLLEEAGALEKIEDYRTSIGHSERTDAVVEPRLSLQWFVDMKPFAKTALEAVKSGEVKFYPESMFNMYQSWLQEDNIRDWCISRQLWWGQRIPAWFLKTEAEDENQQVFVGKTADDALKQAIEKTGIASLTLADLKQDEDVVDTWFSSWLWPISVFDGFKDPKEIAYYYPTQVLVTGWDIMFFWVARMIMSGYEFSPELLGACKIKEKGAMPFKSVYYTGMVRDNKRRKMSKSLGNSPDALALIDTYGADGVRFGVLSSAAAGNDIIFDAPFDLKTQEVLNESKLCEQGRNFCNKLWNALRLLQGWEVTKIEKNDGDHAIAELANQWLDARINQTLVLLQDQFNSYRLSEALITVYKLIWDDFCSWYLELIKPAYGEPIQKKVLDQATAHFEKLMTILHPFMPFVTEEIWHQLKQRAEGEDCVVSVWPSAYEYDKLLIADVDLLKLVTSSVREIRNNHQIKMKEELTLYLQKSMLTIQWLHRKGIKEALCKTSVLNEVSLTEVEIPNTVTFLGGNDKCYLVINTTINVEEEKGRLVKEIEYYQKFISSVENKLSNEKFANSAPADIVNKERQKLADGQTKLKGLMEALTKLG